jgi:hypothetical protein
MPVAEGKLLLAVSKPFLPIFSSKLLNGGEKNVVSLLSNYAQRIFFQFNKYSIY